MNLTNMLSILSATFAGISAGCLFYYAWIVLQKLKFEKNNEFTRRIPMLFRLLLPFLPIVRPLMNRPWATAWREQEKAKLQMAGYFETITAADFTGLKLLSISLGVIVILTTAAMGKFFFGVILGGLLIIYPTIWLRAAIKKRHEAIIRALPNVLDLLTLSVESGRDLLSALQDILVRRQLDPLGEELTQALQEIQVGRKRSEALCCMAQRAGQADLSATVSAINQAEDYGVSIAHLLRIQGDMQRNKRFSMAEKLANESSVKIIIPVVVCILPAVFIILMGPLIANTLQMFAR